MGLRTPISGGLGLATVIDPVGGLWATARTAVPVRSAELSLASLEAPVSVERDERGVPHIFAGSDADAIRAFGYVIAQDRLFQMDFLRRVTAGRLAEVLGPGLIETDRFLRGTGMARAVSENVAAMTAEEGIDLQAATWFSEGVNAYLTGLDASELPLEFRLLGYRPEAWKPGDAFLVGWNLMFDLTFQRESAAVMDEVRNAMSPAEFDRLFRVDEPYSVPIIREEDRHWDRVSATNSGGAPSPREGIAATPSSESLRPGIPLAEGFLPGKGSNNWAVAGSRSTTGAPILAGDMHLGLNLPAIWYEVHLVTPEMDTYGVTVPGVPLPIEAFNRRVGWAFTNTGSDQIDHLSLELNDSRSHYRYEGEWRELELVPDTIRVLGAPAVIDTMRWSHWGPVSDTDGRPLAIQWTGHSRIRTFQALWHMNHAGSYTEFERALRLWDAPMQNILVGAPGDTIAIRSTGYLPVRRDNNGFGVRDGGSSQSDWTGRVPFEELPHAINPPRGYLSSTNQRPAGPDYPYYLGRDWRAVLRSVRIDSILGGQPIHSVDDLASYQGDVHAVQRDMFVPLIDDLDGLSPEAAAFRDVLTAWDGSTDTNRREPVLFSVWEGILQSMTWDEPAFSRRRPSRSRLHEMLTSRPEAGWFDRQNTPAVENARDVLRASLEAAADSVELTGPAWGQVHGLLLRHITGSEALRPLWRGPIPYPGYSETLSPGAGRTVTHSASWRVVLDLSGERIVARGIYPGGQSGNPFSRLYDSSVEDFAAFRHYPLHTPTAPGELRSTLSRLSIRP